jgi:hypothetical protein
MQFNPIPYLAIWSVFALAVIVLLVMRKVVAAKEDDQLHVLHGTTTEQSTVAAKLDVIDKWGKILTVIAVVGGLAIGALYVISSFTSRGGM